MKHIVTLAVLFILVLSVPAEAEIAFGSGTEGTLYSGDGVCQVSALFGRLWPSLREKFSGRRSGSGFRRAGGCICCVLDFPRVWRS